MLDLVVQVRTISRLGNVQDCDNRIKMLRAVVDMFTSSSRPAKRQRIDREVPQMDDRQTTTPRTTRSVEKHASQASLSANGSRATSSNVAVQSLSTSSSDKGSKSDFIDSAYQSMGASPRQGDAGDNMSYQINIPTSRTKRPRISHNRTVAHDKPVLTQNTAKRKLMSQSAKQEKSKGSAVGEDNRIVNDLEEEAIFIRSSGRARTKTWKTVEPDQTSGTTRKDKARAAQKISQSAQRKSSGSIPVPDPALESTTRRSSLKMPKIRAAQPEHGHLQGDLPSEEIDILRTPSKTRNLGRKHRSPNSDNVEVSDCMGSRVEALQAEVNVTPARRRTDIESVELNELLAKRKNRELMLEMKEYIIKHLTGRGNLPICSESHSQAYQKIYQILEQTVTAGEGNSILLIGARSTAKSVIVDAALQELGTRCKDQFHTIRLNGFLHTDDKLALKEIWRQLGKEMAVEDESTSDRTNYADTLASLLAILSQPEELTLSEGNRTTSKSVIFILDEFDLFTTHPRQTLLYNLFDVAQSRKAPIAIIGSTTRIDVVESLEKRVKSRFSHRYVHVSHPKTISAYTAVVRAFLLASHGENDQDHVKSFAVEELRLKHIAEFPHLHKEWSAYVDRLLSDSSVRRLLNRHYIQSKSPQAFLNALLLPIMKLPILPQPADLLVNNLAASDSNLHLLQSLSDAPLALLISAARLDVICDTDTVTFNMAYDEYVRMSERSRLTASANGMIAVSGTTSGGSRGILGRGVALTAWEQLEELGLLLPIAGHGGQTHGPSLDLGRGGKLVRVDVGLEEISSTLGSELGSMLKWCKEI